MKNVLRVASVQFQHRASDKAYNMGRIEAYAAKAAEEGAALIAMPEMCITGYWHVPGLSVNELEALSEALPDGPSCRHVRQLAADLGIGIGAGLIERSENGKLYNSYFVALPDGTVHVHRKLHAFEHDAILSGDRYTVFDTPWGVRIGILICYDNNILENARATALMGADILLAPHQTGGCHSASPHALGLIDVDIWRNRERDPEAIEKEILGPKGREWLMRWLPSRARDNGMFVVFSNGIGEDNGEVRTGNAMIIDPYGRVLTETWAARDEMVVADMDLDLLPMSQGRRWLRVRRPDLYEIIVQPQADAASTREVRFSYAPPEKTGSA
ncbi:putative amidohydrolase [Rhizobium sp. BK529]|uniref:nitrilase family protein n=1 Tax=unclassified Rhizobium TaxID=2613769 RepID=UPI001043A31D|nr:MULTISPECIES: nitrilase family protein [unclassified Rhizobium]MBB3590392.1 putative amidohydrolase [Rhizobium sp. BK529]TCS05084.1 putative amidohydrolase [Rhizobium sp. BK418]